jgi:hypothetical protein
MGLLGDFSTFTCVLSILDEVPGKHTRVHISGTYVYIYVEATVCGAGLLNAVEHKGGAFIVPIGVEP